MSTRLLGAGLLLLAIATAGLSPIRSTLADSGSQISLGIAPIDYAGQYFDLTMQPGESRELKVEVANHGDQQISAQTYAADAYSISGGGFGARLNSEPTTGTTLWLAYAPLTVDLPAGHGLTRPFSVTVPADAGPGEYITSLAVQNADPTVAGSGGVAIKQVQRTVIAVAITVPGPRTPALTIGPFEHGFLSSNSVISASLSNMGNVTLKPIGELVVSDMDGEEVSRFPVAMDSVYAGDAVQVEVPFEKALRPGDYRVTLTLDYEGGTARAVDVPLTVPRPTAAEAGGAPSGAGQAIAATQQQAGSSLPALRWVLLVVGAVLLTVAYFVITGVRRHKSPLPRRPGYDGQSLLGARDGNYSAGAQLSRPVAVAPPRLRASELLIRNSFVRDPMLLRQPLAKAAGEQEPAPSIREPLAAPSNSAPPESTSAKSVPVVGSQPGGEPLGDCWKF